MAQVVVVHGIAREFSGPESLCQRIGPALRDGMRLSDASLSLPDVACAFYGDLYFPPGTRSVDLPPWDEHDVEEGLEIELLSAWLDNVATVDPGVGASEGDGSRGAVGFVASRVLLAEWVRTAMDALSGSRFFAGVSDRMLIFALKQVRRYITEPAIRAAAQSRVAEQVGPDTRVIVGHSLGSVVAYEALCASQGWPVTDLVTLGSPLGMRSVIFERLMPEPVAGVGAWPNGIRRWSNIADPGDIIALPGTLASKFGDKVIDRRVANGARMHDLLRYLTAPTTGAAIAAGLTDPANGDRSGNGEGYR